MGPFIKSTNKTSKMMLHLLISLTPIIIFTFIKNGIIPYIKGYTNILGLFYPLIFILISTLSTFTFETLYNIIFQKRNIKEAIKNTYSIFPGLFLGLILPINTPILILIIGSFISSIIAKMLFGGFGHNIFNPALVGRLFIISIYAIVIGKNGGYLNSYELDTITHSTPLTNIQTINNLGTYETVIKPYGSLLNFFIGTIPGAVGETSALLCLLAFAYLTFFKVIKWKIPVTYILTVFAITYVIGSMNNLGIWYPIFQILSGGLMFGAIFMATDPVTSPVTPIGQILYGLFLGILTVIFRFLTPFPEGVLTSILTMNMFVMILDKIGSLARFNFKITIIPFVIAWILILGLGIGISLNYNQEEDSNFKIISQEENQNKTSYIVTQKGYSSTIKASIIIENGKITTFEILEQNDSFFSKIEQEKYIDKLKQNSDIDTISGATITSTALKTMLKNTLKDYGLKEQIPTEIEDINNKIEEPNEIISEENQIEQNSEENQIEPEENIINQNFSIISKNNIDETTIEYIVLSKGFSGNIKIQALITNGTITTVNILEQNDSYFKKVETKDYIQDVINNQNNIDELDVVSGATITSTGIKNAIKYILIDYNGVTNE